MLLPFLVSGSLVTLGALIVAKVGHVAMRGLGVELYGVLLWLGLAEAPLDELSARRAGVAPSRRASATH